MINLKDIERAEKRIKKYVKKTPIKEIKKGIFLKLENQQPIVKGFKIRGAANTILLSRKTKVMTVALGTHGFAVGHIGKKLGVKTICMMVSNPPKDVERKMKRLVNKIIYGTNVFSETRQLAITYSKLNNIKFIDPYNDNDIIAGQGTIGLELLNQIKNLDAIYVPMGGGGLISGIAYSIKSINPHIKLIGVQPQQMHALIESSKRGKIVSVPIKKSLADKLAVNIDPKTITFNMIKDYVDYFIMPTENEIKKAMKEIYLKTGEITEGSGAITYAAALKDKNRKGISACIISGGNISKKNFEKATKLKL